VDIPDPQTLRVRSWVNGDLRQDSTTARMIWGVAELVSILSQTMTLEPGDLIATGTPAGVGVARRPPSFLADGDVVEVEIESLGRLSNRVQLERAAG
jgi:2-keto-4-pentenoate hydratase/2-oxohepta-3-ene-1,7-dioic acid hydratase in catechol pathway